jgi:penicillin-binding protein 2
MKKHDFYAHRQYPVLIIITIAILLLLIKLFSVQIMDESYKLSAENNVVRKIIKYPERGWVYDRNNVLLISNQRAHDIMVTPYLLDSTIDTLFLCDILQISKVEFNDKMKQAKKYSHYKPSIFLKAVSKEKFADIQDKLHLFKGFYTQPRYVREYNTKSSSNIFGYIGQISKKLLEKYPNYTKEDLIGITGIEKTYEKELCGEKGVERKVVDVFGKYQSKLEDGKYDTLPKKGQDIVLTIDITLQEYAEKIMKNKRGSIVAIEPNTGEILCLVSSPNYDPSLFLGNQRSKNFTNLYLDPSKPLWDRSTSALYPPGSIFKLINALIGLQEKEITPATLFKCNKGWNYKSILHIGCHKHDSPLNLRQSIAQSCNAYYCSTFQKIIANKENSATGLDNWQQHVKSFGLNQLIHTDLHDQKMGFIPNSEYYNKKYGERRWGSSTCISLGIGQDAILMTPIQMANLASIVANKGYYKTPHIVKKINQSIDQINQDFFNKKYCSIDSIYFKPIIYGMETAVEGKHGTAKQAKLKGMKICGKTGTAQNPHGDDHSIFIGFSPRENPKIAIAVYVENGGWGSDVAAPIGSLCIEKYRTGTISRIRLENKMINKNIKY